MQEEGNALRLQTAIEEAVSRMDQREGLASATSLLRPSFDALPKDVLGNVNARAAQYLLRSHFSSSGWQIDGLESHAMQNPSAKVLREALNHVDILRHAFPDVDAALRAMGAAGNGLALHHVAGLAVLIQERKASTTSKVLHVLYKRSGLSIGDSIDQETVEQIIDEYVALLNVEDHNAVGNLSKPALLDPEALISLKSNALEHSSQSKKTTTGLPESFSTDQVTHMAVNLTKSFEQLYLTSHCERMTRQLIAAAPKETGRLRLNTFYNQAWNGSQNFVEAKQFLQAAGALDESGSKTTRVFIANYMHGHLNCIRHSAHSSLCCPNQCVPLMQSIEASVLSPDAAPEQLLDIAANLSTPSMQKGKIPAVLAVKLRGIAAHHGGVVPLHSRFFAQWMHYTFPNECPYPQNAHGRTRRWRLTAKEVSTEDQREVAWASVNKGLEEPASVLRSVAWSSAEVLPLQVEQVWHVSLTRNAYVRVAARMIAFAAAAVLMLQIMRRLLASSQMSAQDKGAKAQDLQNVATRREMEDSVQRKLATLRFEFNVELLRGKGQQDLKVGLQLKSTQDAVGGVEVEHVVPNGLVYLRNKSVTDSKNPVVLTGDRLISVNGQTQAKQMMQEMFQASTKVALRFSREASKAAPLIWTTDLQRVDEESWGISISKTDSSSNSMELAISRVVKDGPVDKWNRRAARQNKCGIYPGDIIIACGPDIATNQILAKLQKASSLELTVLRWHAASAPEGPAALLSQNKINEGLEQAPLQEELCSHAEDSTSVPEQVKHQCCECCGGSISDKYVLMCCSAGHVKYFRRPCWRQKHGGFTIKHMPRRCPCGSPLARLEVYERSGQESEARLVHTILDGPMEVDIAFDDAPDNEEHHGILHRRAASATRRAAQGDARKRVASTGRRVRLPQLGPSGTESNDETPEQGAPAAHDLDETNKPQANPPATPTVHEQTEQKMPNRPDEDTKSHGKDHCCLPGTGQPTGLRQQPAVGRWAVQREMADPSLPQVPLGMFRPPPGLIAPPCLAAPLGLAAPQGLAAPPGLAALGLHRGLPEAHLPNRRWGSKNVMSF